MCDCFGNMVLLCHFQLYFLLISALMLGLKGNKCWPMFSVLNERISQILFSRFSIGFRLLAYVWGYCGPGIVDRSQVLLENEVSVSIKMFSQGKLEVL